MVDSRAMRSFLLAVLSISLVVSKPTVACDCGGAGPACAYVKSANVIFVGKVVFTDDDGSGTFVQMTHVHFQVEESFKGLAPNIQDVWVDPGSLTSCYAEYHVGERLLVFGYNPRTMPPDTTTMSVAPEKGPKIKPLPPGIDPKNPPTVYSAPECSGTRLITPDSEKSMEREIEYLRRFRIGDTRPLVTGRVFQDADFGIFDPPGLSGVKVTIAGDRFQGSTRTDSDGRYSFEGIPVGRYTLNAALPDYRSKTGPIRVELPDLGCGWRDFDMIGSGRVEGQLLDSNGRPAPHVKVNILRLGGDGKPIFYGFKETQSDSRGRYEFEKLPSGGFQVGVNLSSAPDIETPYASTKWSEHGEPTIRLNSGELKRLTPFRLPPEAVVRRISVIVLWPDGRAAGGVDVWAEVGLEVGAHAETDTGGRAQLELLEGIDYTVEAKKWVATGEQRSVARSGTTSVKPGSEPIQLNLRLDKSTKTYR